MAELTPGMNQEEEPLKQRSAIFLASVIISITSGQFALLFYLPALPLIGQDLHVHGAVVENSVAFFLYGFGISQLIYGNLSDSFGRKKILIIGIIILAIGVFMTYLCNSANTLLLSRLIQGLGGGAIAIIPRTILTDSYKGTKFIKAVTVVMLVLSLMPAVAPTIGGGIVTYFSWRILFLVLFVYVVFVLFVVIFLIPETLEKAKRTRFNVKMITKNYSILFKDKKYLSYMFCVMFSYTAMIIYMTFTAFIYEGVFSFTPGRYGLIMIIPALFLALGCSSSLWLPKFTGKAPNIDKSILIGSSIMIIGAVCLFLICMFGLKTDWIVLGCVSVIAIGVGFIFTTSTAGMLQSCTHAIGAGASFSGFVQMIGNGVILFLLSKFKMYNSLYIGVWSCVFGIILLAMIVFLKRVKSAEVQLDIAIEK